MRQHLGRFIYVILGSTFVYLFLFLVNTKLNVKSTTQKHITLMTTTVRLFEITKPACENPPSKLVGREKIQRQIYNFSYLENRFNNSKMGGLFSPEDCEPHSKIAIIIPYRDREEHLKQFLFNMIPKLNRQLISFTIYVVEQAPGSHFNRGMMRNVGFAEASKVANYDCYVFNDVDTVMEDDRNIYKCGKNQNVRHLMSGVDRFKYRLMYASLVGGVIAFTKEQFSEVNGYSNQFFVWGSEDDDLARRIKMKNMTLERPAASLGLYTTLKHVHARRESLTDVIYNSMTPYIDKDGLNSLQYTVVKTEHRKLYTRIYVSVDEEAIRKKAMEKADMFMFLEDRGVKDEVIHEMKKDKIDIEVVRMMDDLALSYYLDSYGDRLALQHYCKSVNSKKRKVGLFEKLKQKMKLRSEISSEDENEPLPKIERPKRKIKATSNSTKLSNSTKPIRTRGPMGLYRSPGSLGLMVDQIRQIWFI